MTRHRHAERHFRRKWARVAGALPLLLSLLILTIPKGVTYAQSASVEKISELISAGRNWDAILETRRYVESSPDQERQAAYRFAVNVCVRTQDIVCTSEALKSMDAYLKAIGPGHVEASTYGYELLLWLLDQMLKGQYYAIPNVVGTAFPDGITTAYKDPILFADLHLLEAERERWIGNFGAARKHVDVALAAVLTMREGELEASRLIVKALNAMIANYDVERALRVFDGAAPLLQKIPKESALYTQYLIIRAGLHGFTGNLKEEAADLRTYLSALEKLQLHPPVKAYLKALISNELIGTLATLEDTQGVDEVLQAHPLLQSKQSIIAKGYFADRNEFYFALTEEFARLSTGDNEPTGWGNLMRDPPRWSGRTEDTQDAIAFGHAAVGLQLLKAGQTEAAYTELVEAGRGRLKTIEENFRKSRFSSPRLYWSDRVLFEYALIATLSSKEPDYGLVTGAADFLRRAAGSMQDDALANEAIQNSGDKRRIVQSYVSIEYQRADWERQQLTSLVQRLRSPPGIGGDRKKEPGGDSTFLEANAFISQLGRLQAALVVENRTSNTHAVAALASVERLLLPDEALIFYIPMRHQIAKVCVRANRTQSKLEDIDRAQLQADSASVSKALTTTRPASVEEDSRYPATEAVRLYNFLFSGLEQCLTASPRVYLIAPDELLDGVPPAVLLAEQPPALDSGFDLRKAHWAIRDHAFVRTSSIAAFVATKRLSRTRTSSLDYLGVGDPVLAAGSGTSSPTPSVAMRGSVPAGSGAPVVLNELPEASEELEAVARMYDPTKVRLLTRERAREESFRLQPLSEFDVVHFATHGLIKEEVPGLKEPSLVLTPSKGGDVFDDGLLTSTQIAALPLGARLVILSACNTARYDPRTIDTGIQNLSASFAIAGVPAIVASLWPVDSAVSRNLIRGVFETARGPNQAPIADALALAQRSHLDDPLTARPLLHPRYWAPLIVGGDGSVELGSKHLRTDRSLRFFAPIDPGSRGEILSAAPAPGGYVISTFGEGDGSRMTSIIQRKSVDGRTLWQTIDHKVGAGLVSTLGETVFAGGSTSKTESSEVRTTPIIRSLTLTGEPRWATSLETKARGAAVLALIPLNDGSVIAVIGDHIYEGSSLEAVRLDRGGAVTLRRELDHAAAGLFESGFAQSSRAGLLIAANEEGKWRPEQVAPSTSPGTSGMCFSGDGADVRLLDAAGLGERVHTKIDGFRMWSALPTDSGWIAVGDLRTGCGIDRRAAALRIGPDLSVERLWSDASPFTTSARAIVQFGAGFEIVGYAERSTAIRGVQSRVEQLKVALGPSVPSLDRIRLGNEGYVSGEVFSVVLNSKGREEARDFVGAGFPAVPQGAVVSDGSMLIYGMVGLRQLWLTTRTNK